MVPIQDLHAPKIQGKVVAPIAAGPSEAPTYVDEILKVRRQKMAEEMVKTELGTGEGKKDQGESLATTIVTRSLDNLNKAEERYKQAAKESKEDAQAAGAALTEAREQLYAVQMKTMADMVGRLEQANKDISRGTAPKSSLDAIRDARELMSIVRGEGGEKAAGAIAAAPDYASQLTLMKMQLDHEMALKRLDLDILTKKQEWDLKLAEFGDNKQQKLMEYQDGKHFRSEGLHTLEDISMAITGGIKHEQEAGGEAIHEAVGGAPEPEMEASIVSWPCQSCKEKILVPHEGGKVACPQCGAEYNFAVKK